MTNEELKIIENTGVFKLHSTRAGVFIGDYKLTNKRLSTITLNSKKEISHLFYNFFRDKGILDIRNIHAYMAFFHEESLLKENRKKYHYLNGEYKKKYAKDSKIFINKYMHKMFGKNYIGQLYYLITNYYCENANKEWLFSIDYRPEQPINYPLIRRMITLSSKKKRVLKILKQNETDNLNHLSPFILFFKHDLAGIKRIVGKKTWKALCKNKITRSRYLIEFWESLGLDFKKRLHMELIQASVLIRTTTLINMVRREAYIYTLSKPQVCEFIWFCYHNKLKPKDVHTIADTLRDTLSIGSNFKAIFNSRWSVKRLEHEHTLLIRKQIMTGMEEEEERILNLDAPFRCKFHIDNTTVYYLNTTTLLFSETYQMVHCVYDYKRLVENKQVFIFHLKNKDDESTLMISARSFRIRQHYGKYNRKITSEELHHAANEVMKMKTDILAHRQAV